MWVAGAIGRWNSHLVAISRVLRILTWIAISPVEQSLVPNSMPVCSRHIYRPRQDRHYILGGGDRRTVVFLHTCGSQPWPSQVNWFFCLPNSSAAGQSMWVVTRKLLQTLTLTLEHSFATIQGWRWNENGEMRDRSTLFKALFDKKTPHSSYLSRSRGQRLITNQSALRKFKVSDWLTLSRHSSTSLTTRRLAVPSLLACKCPRKVGTCVRYANERAHLLSM